MTVFYSWREGHKCPVCGKEFYATPLHVYKDISGKKICSWTCLNKYQREHEKELQIKKDKQSKKYHINGEYLTVKQIAEKAGMSPNTIQSRIRKGYRGETLLAKKIPKERK